MCHHVSREHRVTPLKAAQRQGRKSVTVLKAPGLPLEPSCSNLPQAHTGWVALSAASSGP